MTGYRTLYHALTACYYAQRLGLSLHTKAKYDQVFKCLHFCRPYKGPTQLSAQEYVDQCILVSRVVSTISRGDALYCNPVGVLTHNICISINDLLIGPLAL